MKRSSFKLLSVRRTGRFNVQGRRTSTQKITKRSRTSEITELTPDFPDLSEAVKVSPEWSVSQRAQRSRRPLSEATRKEDEVTVQQQLESGDLHSNCDSGSEMVIFHPQSRETSDQDPRNQSQVNLRSQSRTVC
jgi:hypothetical protein